MAGIFTRKAITAILNDEGLTPEERTDQLFSLYGRALDDGYVTKSAAQAATNEAVEAAKAQAIKDFKVPDVKESAEYKALQEQFNGYKVKQEARTSAEFASVKPKFFDTVYDRIDRADGAKPIAEQLENMRKDYEEYFNPQKEPEKAAPVPQFGNQVQGQIPKGTEESSFSKFWGYKTTKES